MAGWTRGSNEKSVGLFTVVNPSSLLRDESCGSELLSEKFYNADKEAMGHRIILNDSSKTNLT